MIPAGRGRGVNLPMKSHDELEVEILKLMREQTALQRQVRPLLEQLTILRIRIAVACGEIDEVKAGVQ